MRPIDKNIYILVYAFVLAGFLISCSSPRRTGVSAERRLEQAYSEWRGAPYRLGGTTKNGVDCSAFVQIVMRDKFGVRLPRTTSEQIRSGKRVRRNQIRTGDLIFFQTGRRTLHVGIVVKGDRFLHASTSRGVIMDRFTDKYWSDRYITTRRVF